MILPCVYGRGITPAYLMADSVNIVTLKCLALVSKGNAGPQLLCFEVAAVNKANI